MSCYQYEFDSEMSVLIRTSRNESPMIFKRPDPVWRHLGPQDESYSRAIFLGQGCWERLSSISEEHAQMILNAWSVTRKCAVGSKSIVNLEDER